MTASASALEGLSPPRALVRALFELSKPGITRMVLITSGLGALLAAGPTNWVTFGCSLVGTAAVVAGANALNMFLERDSDALMERTRERPLPSGRISPDVALSFGVGVSIAGLALLAHFTTMAAVGLAALALLSYVLVYTPLKRVTWFALPVGAVPGALPPAIGYASMTGTLDRAAISLFAILFAWQLPHFLAISIFRRVDYGQAGLRVLPNDIGVQRSKWVAIAFAIFLFATTLLPWFWGIAGWSYLVVTTLTTGAFVAFGIRGLTAKDDNAWARSFFLASMPQLVIVFAALVISAS